jgi:hypothetical protein
MVDGGVLRFFGAGPNLLWPDYVGSIMIETKNADPAGRFGRTGVSVIRALFAAGDRKSVV